VSLQICVAPLAALRADLPQVPGAPEAWLTRSEAARHQAFSLPARRQGYLAGRWLLRRLLAAATGALAPLEQDAEGRSHCPQWPDWRLSLSHSGDWFAAAVGQGMALGIDIEQPKPGRNLGALVAGLGLETTDAASFYRHWTLGEAWLKQGPGPGLLAVQRQLRWQPDEEGAGRCWYQPEQALHLALWAPTPASVCWCPYPGAPGLEWHEQGRWRPASDDPALNRILIAP